MAEDSNKLERTLALNIAADKLGFDETTRRAMTHMETLITAMSQAELTWGDIPAKFSLESALGETTLQTVCALDPGFELTVRAQHDPKLRTSLLESYVECIGIARPGETATIEQTLQALINRES